MPLLNDFIIYGIVIALLFVFMWLKAKYFSLLKKVEEAEMSDNERNSPKWFRKLYWKFLKMVEKKGIILVGIAGLPINKKGKIDRKTVHIISKLLDYKPYEEHIREEMKIVLDGVFQDRYYNRLFEEFKRSVFR